MPEIVCEMTINGLVFSIPCKVGDFLSTGWVLAGISYYDHRQEKMMIAAHITRLTSWETKLDRVAFQGSYGMIMIMRLMQN